MAITVGSPLKKASASVAYTVDDQELKGGFRCVASITERNAIPIGGRRPGMIVRVVDVDAVTDWTLPISSLANSAWVEQPKGGGGGGDGYVPTAGGDMTGKFKLSNTGSIDFNGKAKLTLNSENVLYTSTSPSNGLAFSNGTENTIEFDIQTGQITAKTEIALSSDKRLKKKVKTIANSLDITEQLRGVFFTWKATDADSMGVIAQELEKVLPFLVTKGSDGKLAVLYTALAGLFIQNIKELIERDKLNAQTIAELQTQIKELMNK
jgi:hypothetical protein